MNLPIRLAATLLLAGMFAADAAAAPDYAAERNVILKHYAAEARAADPAFKGFSAAAGRAFFLAHPASARPATPSCSSCHTSDPRNTGHTRAGKEILPMAVSRTPSRFTKLAKVEQWFRRNCDSVYGRVCTPQEKGNYITFMASE
jgi:hypothetical protein